MKIIEVFQQNLIECDNPTCGYCIPNPTGDINISTRQYINMPCPQCGENLCTQEDNDAAEKFVKIINRANKWFGWLSIFFGTETVGKKVDVKVHEGIKIKEQNGK